MAITYEKVISVISQAPSNRKDFEVNNLLPWFRKKSDLFRNLKQDLLFDLIKNLNFVTKQRDELVIKQFDYGDTMYILLRGQITIYILYPKKIDDDDEAKPATEQIVETEQNIRQQLGTFVTNLGPGATFGEIALLKDNPEDCKRTASIIANDTVDLIEIDRNLYNRSVKNVLKKEFEDKSNFIAGNPFFQTWAPKYKKQLAMALQIDVFQYDSTITKQGEPIDSIYFILRGEVKLIVDPSQHKQQYPKYYEHHFDPIASKNSEETENMTQERLDHLKSMSNDNKQSSNSENQSYSSSRRKRHKKPLEVCLLGVNEVIGDIETLLDLDTSLQTAKCTQRTEVLVLEMKHFERLLVKRNPRTVKIMKECLDLRLKSRMAEHAEELPLIKELYFEILDFVATSQGQTNARHHNSFGSAKHSKVEKGKPHRRTVEEYFNSFIPPPGALVDMYGPGTVFHRIREREKAKLLLKQKQLREKGNHGGNHLNVLTPRATLVQSSGQPHVHNHDHHSGDDKRNVSSSQDVDPMTSDPVLKNLEERMRNWLQWEGSNSSGSNHSRNTPRVSKLHRTQVEEENLKPGAKVVFRPRASNGSFSPRFNLDSREDEDQSIILHTDSWKGTNGSTRSSNNGK